ncbi:MAG: sigma-70 family RNA polymerase sigma factor [Acidobacteria bacterium]|nr:sigma-70 family RNA polymerase sigma factor [Acidobacteriota bacterium]
MPYYPLHEELAAVFRPVRSTVTLEDEVAQLFEEARDDVYRYLLTLGLHPPQAQEAAQEVFLRLYTSLKKGEDIQNRRGWVFRVAHNLGLKLRARQNAQPFDPEMEVRIMDPVKNPEASLLERERMVRINRAISGLSEQQRRCLQLRLEGLRYPEIGEILGISASTVGEFLRRALNRLRKEEEGLQ